ncbi:hypothetical protein BD414DRAFT_493485 [Trametes punicea]|nr:hypothetical protein BD414DRAFT_493485 [Trametes punicea]
MKGKLCAKAWPRSLPTEQTGPQYPPQRLADHSGRRSRTFSTPPHLITHDASAALDCACATLGQVSSQM